MGGILAIIVRIMGSIQVAEIGSDCIGVHSSVKVIRDELGNRDLLIVVIGVEFG